MSCLEWILINFFFLIIKFLSRNWFIWKKRINIVTYFICLSEKGVLRSSRIFLLIWKFNTLGNKLVIGIGFITLVLYILYIQASSFTGIQFSNTVVTVKNESIKTLEYLMHFCSSSGYAMWQAFCTVLVTHIY